MKNHVSLKMDILLFKTDSVISLLTIFPPSCVLHMVSSVWDNTPQVQASEEWKQNHAQFQPP